MCNSEPLVSIIMPAFNASKFIGVALDSILNQNYQYWEVLIVDDGSIDDTVSIAKQYSDQDNRVRVYKRNRDPKGGSTCRNIGLEKVVGKYVIFFDSDDLLLPICLEQRVNKMEDNKTDDFAVFQQHSFSDSLENSKLFTKLLNKNILFCILATDTVWQTMGAIWKLEFLKKIGGFNEKYPRFQDDELHLRAMMEKNVSYSMFPELPFDCYYRDIDRSQDNEYCFAGVQSLKLFITSVIDNYESIIPKKKMLYRSMNAALTKAFVYFMQSKNIEPNIMRELTELLYKKNLLKKIDFSFFEELIAMYQKDSNDKYIDYEYINTTLWRRFHREASYIQLNPFMQNIKRIFNLQKSILIKVNRKLKINFIVG